MYESCVGAQMPVVSILRDIIQSGDKVQVVEGLLSGTLGYVFDRLTRYPEIRFSQALKEACALGITEMNPCVDLDGTDTAHKCVILARELGLQLELEDVEVESLIPESLSAAVRSNADVTSPEKLDALLVALREEGADGAIAKRLSQAASMGEVLRYVAEIDAQAGTVKASLKSFPLGSGSASLRGTEVRVAFKTERHATETPLVVRCPGAGPPVIASSLFNDVLRLSRTIDN